MAVTFENYGNGLDPLFPMTESGQTRYSHMICYQFVGSRFAASCARFIREYTNRDGTRGIPASHIGATSPYITDNMIYFFFQDNAKIPFTQDEADGLGVDLATLEATRAAAVAANATLVANVVGSEYGWRS